MTPDDLAAELPPPRDDEPESLRQDVVDELADHLHCAMQRELLAGSGREPAAGCGPNEGNGTDSQQAHAPSSPAESEAMAYRRVLARFGNPSALARRLWLDAMKERLMAQRLTAIMATLAAAACLLILLLNWRSMREYADRSERLFQEQQQLNQTLMEQLTAALAERPGEADADWVAMQVRLVDEAGEPAEGTVQVSGKPFGNDSDQVSTRVSAREDGVVELESLPTGKYTLGVETSNPRMYLREDLVLGPGRPTELTITCPSPPTETFTLGFNITPPADLAEMPLYFTAAIAPTSREIAGRSWQGGMAMADLLISPRGSILGRIVGVETVRSNITDAATGRVFHEDSVTFALAEVAALPVLPALVEFRAYLPRNAAWADLDLAPRSLQVASARGEVVRTFDSQRSVQETIALSPGHRFWSNVRERLDEVETYHSQEIQLVAGSADGSPARGFDVFLKRSALDGNPFKYYVTPGDMGTVLTVSEPGTYNVVVSAPWGEQAEVPVVVGPESEPGPTRIVCPASEDFSAAMPVQIGIKEPANIADRGLRYLLRLLPIARSTEPGVVWERDMSFTKPMLVTERSPDSRHVGRDPADHQRGRQ